MKASQRKQQAAQRRQANRENYQNNRRNWTIHGGPKIVPDEPTEAQVKDLLLCWLTPKVLAREVKGALPSASPTAVERVVDHLILDTLPLDGIPYRELWSLLARNVGPGPNAPYLR